MQKKTDKKEHIMSVSQKLFSEMGFEATSTREIAKESGVNIAMIAYYFGSKEHLLEEIIHSKLESIKLNEEEIISNNRGAEQMLEKFVQALIGKFIENSAFYNILHSELTIKQRVFSGEKYYAIKLHNDSILEKIIRKGIDEQVFSKNNNSKILQAFIIGPYVNVTLNKKYYMKELGYDTEEMFHQYIKASFTKKLTKAIINLLKDKS